MPQALIGTGGFLCAVLWMDLMFDVQAWGHAQPLPPEVLESIAAYYHRVTTEAAPMGNVVSLMMILTVLGAVVQLAHSRLPMWLRVGALATAVIPTLTALVVIVPAAVRLGGGDGDPQTRAALVETILTGHLWCLALMLTFVVLQIVVVQRLRGAAP